MQAIEITQAGGPEVLRLCERPRPVPGAGELLIAVAASGMSRPDVAQRMGRYPPPTGASDIPGLEVAGTVVEGDAPALQAAGLHVGAAVCALVSGGGYAQYCVAPIGQCLPVPQGLTLEEAAALPETYFTVYSNVFERGALRVGQTLLVHGGSSGIGSTAIQLARALGSRVIATAGSAAKCRICVELGAAAINYREEDFVTRVLELTDGRGVDVILDMVAGDYVARNMQCCAEDGRIVVIATQGGSKVQIDLGLLYRKRIQLTGSTLRARSVAFKSALAERLRARIWPLLEAAEVRPLMDSRYPAAEVVAAHARMDSMQHSGKIVLLWS